MSTETAGGRGTPGTSLSVGCVFPRFSGLDGVQRRRVVRLAEEAGLDHVGFGDHVSFHTGAGLDGLLAAAGVLAASDTLSANTGIYLLPLRHPVPVARQLADLAVLAPGRFVFGVGVGGEDRHEYEVCGVDPATRGRRLDEAIHVVRSLLAGGPTDFEGEHFRLQQAQVTPTPAVPVPVVVGGRSDAAIHRAGRVGDGWWGIWVSAERYLRSLELMAEAASDAGRAAPDLNALNVWCGVGDSRGEARDRVAPAMQAFYGIPYERFERWSPAGPPEDVATFLAPYVESGCRLVNLVINGNSVEHEVEAAAEIRSLLVTPAG
jgi:alkanesulfonate monooxygenase SsuD/methylene tetrahydromethanopterin reductase-like flavin-dependent oxidoreductase (luciferase family)